MPCDVGICVPRDLLADVIDSLKVGGEAVLDRDWNHYSEEERLEAARFVEARFRGPLRRLELLLES